MTAHWRQVLRQLDDYRWEIPQEYKEGMRAPGVVFASQALLGQIIDDQSLEQVANVAFLPGIVGASLAMPDIHLGYGFAVGGVAATRVGDGVISPGGVGFDINCGVRLLRSDLTEAEVRPRLEQLVATLFTNVPSGVGSSGKIRLSEGDLDHVLEQGAGWAVGRGMGTPDDLEVTEERGCIPGADVTRVSSRARSRGAPQLGTLGSGNHFLEVQAVQEVYDPQVAGAMGIEGVGQVTVLVHCGSRGFGHQVCTDHLKVMDAAMGQYGIRLPDRQLACAPLSSPQGQDYLAAMRCAANFAWANRQCIAHWVRESFSQVFDKPGKALGLEQVYDVAHNIAKLETYTVEGKPEEVCVHRKGAVRAFPAGHADLPARYRAVGQPVPIPGDMGRYSFLMVGQARAMEVAFGSACHGAGRTQSRAAARRILRGRDVERELREQGIIVKAHSWDSLAEEASIAYKDVAEVVDVCHQAGLARRVAKMRPLAIVKG